MNQREIFAQRLKNARVMNGFSMDDLVKAMDGKVSKMAISKYERGELFPSSSVVIELSNSLRQPIDYFFRPFEVSIDSIRFRKHKSKLTIKQEKALKESISDLIERYISIEEICNATISFESPIESVVFAEEDVIAAVKRIRTEWNIGNDGIVGVIDFLENHGVKVLEITAPDSFDGLSSIVNDKYPVVVLNKSFSPERKRFTALHELGHLVLPFDSSIEEKQEEKLCNFFASEMLISEDIFKKEIGASRSDISYQELKALQLSYGISCDALMYKAKDCGIIRGQRYKSFCIQKRRSPSFKELIERSLYPEEESCRFSILVYRALSSELITVSKAATLLHQTVEQVRGDLALV